MIKIAICDDSTECIKTIKTMILPYEAKYQLEIKTFESGAGDCIFLVMKDEMDNSCFHIMMDCNVLTDEIKAYIRDELYKRIDVLIVTHIDSVMLMV